MAAFSGFRPFLTKGSTLNGVQNTFFANSVNGVHYVPDAADVYGPTGLAAVGTSIGAVFDEKNGVPTFGPNLIVNGTFDTNLTGWSFNTTGNGTQAVVDGVVSLSSAKNYPTDRAGIYQSLNLTRGTYLLEFDVIERDISFFWAFVGTVYGSSDISGNGYSPAVGRAVMVLHIPGGNTWIEWRISGTAKFDNLSLRLVSGNAAIQNTAAARPLIGRAPVSRRNMLTWSESFGNADWTKTGATISTTLYTAPNGELSANAIVPTGTGFNIQRSYSTNTTGTYTASISVKDNGAGSCMVAMGSNTVGYLINVNLTTGAFISGRSYGGGSLIGYTINSQGNGWWRVTVSATAILASSMVAAADGTSPTSGILIWGAQLETGSVATAYQKVGAVTDVTESSVTAYPFIRLDLSDDVLTTSNLVSTKNLIRFTEEFDNAAWTKQLTTVTANTATAPDGTVTADLVTATAGSNCHYVYQANLGTTSVTFSVYAKAGTANWLGLGSGYTNGNETAWFNLATGTLGTVASGGTSTMVDAGNGWWRCSITRSTWVAGGALIFISNADAVSVFNAVGTETILLWGGQGEIGSAATAYEYGGFKGTALVAGRSGTSIDTVTLPNGVFSLGPATYTGGTTGILRAVGDIVGYTLTGRTTTSIEQDLLIDFYKARGAKGRLIIGSELVTNGTFNTDTSGWGLVTGTASINSSGVSITNTTGRATLSQTLSTTVGRTYIVIGILNNLASGPNSAQIRITSTNSYSGTLVSGFGSTSGGDVPFTFTFTSTANVLYIWAANNTVTSGATVQFDNISVKELRPKEEW